MSTQVMTLQIAYRTVKDGTTWYLAKWRDLPYDQATWETGETEDNVIADFDKMVDEYHALRYDMTQNLWIISVKRHLTDLLHALLISGYENYYRYFTFV